MAVALDAERRKELYESVNEVYSQFQSLDIEKAAEQACSRVQKAYSSQASRRIENKVN
jgi:hypothetical protein